MFADDEDILNSFIGADIEGKEEEEGEKEETRLKRKRGREGRLLV